MLMFEKHDLRFQSKIKHQLQKNNFLKRVMVNNNKFNALERNTSRKLEHLITLDQYNQTACQNTSNGNGRIDYSQNSLYNTIQRKNPFYRFLFHQNNPSKNKFYQYVPNDDLIAKQPQDMFTDQKIRITLHRQTNPFNTSMMSKFRHHTNVEEKITENEDVRKIRTSQTSRIRSNLGSVATKSTVSPDAIKRIQSARQSTRHSARYNKQSSIMNIATPNTMTPHSNYNYLYKVNKKSNHLMELIDSQELLSIVRDRSQKYHTEYNNFDRQQTQVSNSRWQLKTQNANQSISLRELIIPNFNQNLSQKNEKSQTARLIGQKMRKSINIQLQ